MFKTNFYIGSTNNYKQRMDNHKSNCNNPNSPHHNYKIYKFIRDNGGWSNWSKMIIANIDVKNKLEQKKYEQFYIDLLEPSLNCCRSYITSEQLKEQLKEYYKEYYNRNKEKINERQRKKMNCICGGRYTRRHKSHHERTNIHQNYLLNIKQTNLIKKYIK